jgi:hypothetical protein
MELWESPVCLRGKCAGHGAECVQICDGGVITVARQHSASEQDVDVQRSEAMSIFPQLTQS